MQILTIITRHKQKYRSVPDYDSPVLFPNLGLMKATHYGFWSIISILILHFLPYLGCSSRLPSCFRVKFRINVTSLPRVLHALYTSNSLS